MKSVLTLAALASMCGAQAFARSAEPSDNPMEGLSVEQTMRLATLSPARIAEMRCAGLGQWMVAHRPRDAKSPTGAAAGRLSSEVTAAIANDAELSVDVAKGLVAVAAAEAGHVIADKGEAAFAAEVDACASLYAAATAPGPLTLHRRAAASVVSPSLASCYAQYRVAATLSDGEEAANLTASAQKAYQLALKGKSGDARAAAEAALAAEFRSVADAPPADQEAGVMRLIMCQPMMAAAESGGAAR